MKNILKRILIFSITLLLSISNSNGFKVVNAITVFNKNTEIEIYEIKDKKDVGISDNIIDLYKTDPNNEDFKEYKEQQAKIEMENYRLEKERQERIAYKTKLVNYAKRFIGNPYVLGGNSLTSGTDCSGFIQIIYNKFGYKVPRTTAEQATVGIEASIEDIEIGDLISYGYNGKVSHSAIYMGNGRIVHASTPELGIRTDNMYMMPIITIRRVI